MKLLRTPVVAAFLSVFWISVQPDNAHAQLPRIDAIAGAKDAKVQERFVIEEPSGQVISTFDETQRGAFRRFFCEGEWYFSWGFSRESWGHTNIHVSQPTLGNNFTVYNVRATDDPSWTSLFGTQYNIRLGRFVDEARTLAVEFNFDHTRYTSVLGQTARVAGTIAGQPTDSNIRLDEPFFSYKLHNGANHCMFNLVKRVPLIGEPNERFGVAGLVKVGVGFMAPHPENLVMGYNSDVGKKEFRNLIGTQNGWWQVDGFTTGIEFGLRVGLTRHIYLELTDKVAYARLFDVPVYQGSATHNLWMNEVILSVGVTWGGR